MGQSRNTNRNASLDDRKERSVGRQNETKGPHQGNRNDFDTVKPGQGQAGGAFGRGRVSPKPSRKD